MLSLSPPFPSSPRRCHRAGHGRLVLALSGTGAPTWGMGLGPLPAPLPPEAKRGWRAGRELAQHMVHRAVSTGDCARTFWEACQPCGSPTKPVLQRPGVCRWGQGSMLRGAAISNCFCELLLAPAPSLLSPLPWPADAHSLLDRRPSRAPRCPLGRLQTQSPTCWGCFQNGHRAAFSSGEPWSPTGLVHKPSQGSSRQVLYPLDPPRQPCAGSPGPGY